MLPTESFERYAAQAKTIRECPANPVAQARSKSSPSTACKFLVKRDGTPHKDK
jgi:hypothetical protein